MLKIILCEDDANHMSLSKEYIENTIRMFGEEYQIRSFGSAEDVQPIDMEWANVAFLDIDLGYDKKNGIELAKQAMFLNKWIAIIFITCYQEYTKEAFKLQAFGYLEKPIVKRELVSIVERLIKYIKTDEANRFIEVFYNRKQTMVRLDDIIYIEKRGRKVTLFTMIKDFEVTQSIATLEAALDDNFIKVNQGVLVNRKFVNRLEGDMIYVTTGEGVKVSRSRMKSVSGQLK